MSWRRHKGFVRTYFPDDRFVRLRIRNPSHEIPNPSPDVLPPDAYAFWEDVAMQSQALYGPHAEQHDIPEKTAWRAVRMHWQQRGGQWVRQQPDIKMPFVLPSPEDVTWLGLLLEYYWITPEGELWRRQFEDPDLPVESQAPPPDLWWSYEMKTLFAFPTIDTTGPCNPIQEELQDQAEMYRRWAKRDAQCQLGFDVPLARMYWRGMGDSVSYRSDKWNDRNEERGLPGSKEYIHLHDDGVGVFEDTPYVEQLPNVVVIRGGNLDVEERGIIH